MPKLNLTGLEKIGKSLRDAMEPLIGPLTTPISIRIGERQLDHLKRLARHQAVKDDQDVSYVDLIRQAIELQFPLPKEKK